MYRACVLLVAFGLGAVLAVAISLFEKPRHANDVAEYAAAQSAASPATVATVVQPASVAESPAALPGNPVAADPPVATVEEPSRLEPTVAEPEIEDLVETTERPVLLEQPLPSEPAAQPYVAHRPITPEPELYWHDNYEQAWTEAKGDRRMLFIYFHDRQATAARRAFESQTLDQPKIKTQLANYTLAKLPVDATVKSQGQQVTLLKHPSFAEMQGRQGVAVVDLAHPKTEYYSHVVSTFPFTRGKFYRGPALSVVLGLPPGTLTQRTMIYAVRIHPEAPASTHGQFNNALAEEAKMHSNQQAAMLLQGHHNWENRFHRINARLPGGVLAQEVVAESWPNESLVDACIDCVDSWRQSPGHWSAVRSRHPVFGFDIKRGRNGIWYATGIFGRR